MTPEDIRDIRQELWLTQAEFARKFGLPLKTVQNWEQGVRTPDAASIRYLNIIRKYPKLAEKTALVLH